MSFEDKLRLGLGALILIAALYGLILGGRAALWRARYGRQDRSQLRGERGENEE